MSSNDAIIIVPSSWSVFSVSRKHLPDLENISDKAELYATLIGMEKSGMATRIAESMSVPGMKTFSVREDDEHIHGDDEQMYGDGGE